MTIWGIFAGRTDSHLLDLALDQHGKVAVNHCLPSVITPSMHHMKGWNVDMKVLLFHTPLHWQQCLPGLQVRQVWTVSIMFYTERDRQETQAQWLRFQDKRGRMQGTKRRSCGCRDIRCRWNNWPLSNATRIFSNAFKFPFLSSETVPHIWNIKQDPDLFLNKYVSTFL